jgi:hypothetical protein
MATTTTTRKTTPAKKPVATKPTTAKKTVTKKPTATKPVAKKPATRKPAARKTVAPKKTVVSAPVTDSAPVTAATKAAEEGLLTRFFTFTFDYVGETTSGIGGNVFEAIPGLPKGVSEKLTSAQSKVMKGTTGQIESVTVAGASAVGKGLKVLTAPIRKLIS